MMRLGTWIGLWATVFMVAFSSSGLLDADDKKRDIPIPGKVRPKAEVEETKNDAWRVTVTVDSPNNTYSVNAAVTITVTSAESGYLYLINADESGNIFSLFPNEFQSNPDIQANTSVVIPAPDNPKKFRFRADKPGKEIIKAIVTKEPLGSIDAKELATRAVTKVDRTKFVRLVTEAMGGDPTTVPPEQATDPAKPPTGDQKPQVVVQKQKIETEQPDLYKKKKKQWATGEVIITIVDTRQKPDQKDVPDKNKPKPDQRSGTKPGEKPVP